jgi:methylated-DNA-[protein]-cysteine S-methyltransferase
VKTDDLERALAAALPAPDPEAAARAAAAAAARAAQTGAADLAYALEPSPVGELLAVSGRNGLVLLSFDGARDAERRLAELAERLSPRIVEAPARLDPVRRQLDEYFAGERTDFDLPVDLALIRTPFGRAVLAATARIPYGGHASYREIATAAGSPRAVRAAGTALGANPVPIVVPCHRVLRSGGALGGYGGGLTRKRFLLGLEGG